MSTEWLTALVICKGVNFSEILLPSTGFVQEARGLALCGAPMRPYFTFTLSPGW
jgi:hypothetical protein